MKLTVSFPQITNSDCRRFWCKAPRPCRATGEELAIQAVRNFHRSPHARSSAEVNEGKGQGLHADRAPCRHRHHRHPCRDRHPLFLSQRQKGVDAGLKSDLKSAATALETKAVEGTWTAASATAVASVASDFTPTKNNTVTVKGGSVGGYCITASNKGASGPAWYDSKQGGPRRRRAGGLLTRIIRDHESGPLGFVERARLRAGSIPPVAKEIHALSSCDQLPARRRIPSDRPDRRRLGCPHQPQRSGRHPSKPVRPPRQRSRGAPAPSSPWSSLSRRAADWNREFRLTRATPRTSSSTRMVACRSPPRASPHAVLHRLPWLRELAIVTATTHCAATAFHLRLM
jgi:hypothetical protein